MSRSRNYTEEERREAVTAYVVHGTLAGAARACNMPWKTIQAWKNGHPSWWAKISEQVWESHEAELQAGYRKTVSDSMVQIHDRIENGDVVLRGDKQIRVPVKALDLAKISGIAQDKLNLSRGKPTAISGRQDMSTKNKLEELKRHVSNVIPVKATGDV